MFFNKVLAALVPQLVTAVCFRSFIAADDTTAVPGLIPDVHGAPLRQTMTKINCTDGVLDEEVGHNSDQTCPMPFDYREAKTKAIPFDECYQRFEPIRVRGRTMQPAPSAGKRA